MPADVACSMCFAVAAARSAERISGRALESWQGALKPQVIYVEYRSGTDHVLKDVSLNEKPPSFPE